MTFNQPQTAAGAAGCRKGKMMTSKIDKIKALAADPAATNGERQAAVEALKRLGIVLDIAPIPKTMMWLKFWGSTEQIEQIKALPGVKSAKQIKDYWFIFCDEPKETKRKIDELLS